MPALRRQRAGKSANQHAAAAPRNPSSQGGHSLQCLGLRQRALVARQGGSQGIQAVDEEDALICGVQVGPLVHPAGRQERRKEGKGDCPLLATGWRRLMRGGGLLVKRGELARSRHPSC